MNLKKWAERLKKDVPAVFLSLKDEQTPLPALVALTVRLIPRAVWEKNRSLAEDLWADGKPNRWYYALPIILFWMLTALLILRAVLR